MGDNLKYSSAIGATPLVQRAAAKYGSSYLTIPAPLYILNDIVREQLKDEPAMANVFEQCGKMDMLLPVLARLTQSTAFGSGIKVLTKFSRTLIVKKSLVCFTVAPTTLVVRF